MIIVILALVLLLAAFLIWQNNFPTVDEYAVESPALPEELDGCKIVQLSDLHNKCFGEDQKRLVAELEKIEPDLILLTGDLIDKRRTREDGWGNALSLIRQAAELAPVFYVSGNHEWESGLYKKLRPQLETLGAEVLDDGFVILDHGNAALAVMGLSDPAAFSKNVKAGQPMKKEELPACAKKVGERLKWICEQQEPNAFQVLIAHRPQLLEMYAGAGVHLVFSGHAHGGQVRLPGLGALYAPDQGWRPEYTEGPYIMDNTVMIVSRGLGNSAFPLRVFDRPQIVVVTLKAPEEDAPEDSVDLPPEEMDSAEPDEAFAAAAAEGVVQEAAEPDVFTVETAPEEAEFPDALNLGEMPEVSWTEPDEAEEEEEGGTPEAEMVSPEDDPQPESIPETPAEEPDESGEEELPAAGLSMDAPAPDDEELLEQMLAGDFPLMNEPPDEAKKPEL